MKIYADRPLRRLAQLSGDVLALVWIALWLRAARALHETLEALAHPGALLETAGSGLAEHMRDAAAAAEGVPLVGDRLSAPLSSTGAAGEELAAAGAGFRDAVAGLALDLSLLTAVLSVLVALVVWLPPRIRWVRRASDARGLRSLPSGTGDRLLALRALSSAPVGALHRVHPDPMGAWSSGDPDAVAGLAAVELRRLGLRQRTHRSG